MATDDKERRHPRTATNAAGFTQLVGGRCSGKQVWRRKLRVEPETHPTLAARQIACGIPNMVWQTPVDLSSVAKSYICTILILLLLAYNPTPTPSPPFLASN